MCKNTYTVHSIRVCVSYPLIYTAVLCAFSRLQDSMRGMLGRPPDPRLRCGLAQQGLPTGDNYPR